MFTWWDHETLKIFTSESSPLWVRWTLLECLRQSAYFFAFFAIQSSSCGPVSPIVAAETWCRVSPETLPAISECPSMAHVSSPLQSIIFLHDLIHDHWHYSNGALYDWWRLSHSVAVSSEMSPENLVFAWLSLWLSVTLETSTTTLSSVALGCLSRLMWISVSVWKSFLLLCSSSCCCCCQSLRCREMKLCFRTFAWVGTRQSTGIWLDKWNLYVNKLVMLLCDKLIQLCLSHGRIYRWFEACVSYQFYYTYHWADLFENLDSKLMIIVSCQLHTLQSSWLINFIESKQLATVRFN